ncbi:hypothetical protein GQ53DRAFT_422004 [Thozetella sp. PMI_491]|nr:hypothetical protein GQ53DRAFT_422004 [Thozetella sp. PMI_491]
MPFSDAERQTRAAASRGIEGGDGMWCQYLKKYMIELYRPRSSVRGERSTSLAAEVKSQPTTPSPRGDENCDATCQAPAVRAGSGKRMRVCTSVLKLLHTILAFGHEFLPSQGEVIANCMLGAKKQKGWKRGANTTTWVVDELGRFSLASMLPCNRIHHRSLMRWKAAGVS